MLGGLKLYQKSPHSENTTAALLKFIWSFCLKRQGWVCAMMHRASMNTCDINRLVEYFEILLVNRIICLSYLLNLVSDEMMKGDKLKKVMKYLNQMRQYPKLNKSLVTLYGEQCLGNISVLWYNYYEFVVQISKNGLGKILHDYVAVANSRSRERNISRKLLNYFDNNNVEISKVVTAAESIWYPG